MFLREVTIHSSDLNGTGEYYSALFGAGAVFASTNQLCVRTGNSLLRFLPHSGHPVYHFAFNIPCNQIREAADFASSFSPLLHSNTESPVVDFKNWDAEAVYFCDNNKNVLEFIARRELRNESSASFSAASILNISEIGIVVPGVAKEVESLSTNFGIEPYNKQPVLKNFAAVGDANGLIIISAFNRNWFPTEIPAQNFPCDINFETRGKKHFLKFS